MTTPDTIRQLRAAAELAQREQRPLVVAPGAVLALLDAYAAALSSRDLTTRALVSLVKQIRSNHESITSE